MPDLARIDTPLKRVLTEEGRRQNWLAERLSARLDRNIDTRQVWNWVHGIHRPEQATQQAIAEVLDRHVSELWPDLDSAPEPTERAA